MIIINIKKKKCLFKIKKYQIIIMHYLLTYKLNYIKFNIKIIFFIYKI